MISKTIKLLKSPYFWLVIILFLGLWVRLYKLDNPVADWHSWRQADTAAVARNFYKEGYNPFMPKYDDMSGVAEFPVPNPNRHRFVEFPIYNSLVYFAYLLNGGVDERLARLISALISLGSLVFVFLITRRFFGNFTALVASLLFALLPFNVFFSRVILPEPTLVFFSLGMFYFVNRWIFEEKLSLYFVSILFTACAFLVKPAAIFYLLPLIYSYYQKEQRWWPIPIRYFGFIIPALLPFIGWRVWMSQFPEGIPASNWLFDGKHLRFKPSFWRWILGDRFGREILGVTGSVLFFIGLLVKPKLHEGLLLHLLVLSSFLFLIVFATGNVQHDYYQTLIVPAIVIFTARGFVVLLQGIPSFVPRFWTIPFALLFLPVTFYITWLEVRGLYQINNPVIVEAGQHADRILPKDAVVVAPYQGDTSFLYQTNRTGWAVVPMPIKDLIDTYKVHYYISTTKDAKTKWVMRKYTVLEDNDRYVIVDLTRETPNFDRLNDPEP